MVRYLYRSCPRCNGYVGIVLREPGRDTLQAVNGSCLRCSYRMAWIVMQSKSRSAVRGIDVCLFDLISTRLFDHLIRSCQHIRRNRQTD